MQNLASLLWNARDPGGKEDALLSALGAADPGSFSAGK